jgi:competence ComEA-like helix-hairpin-helix protein
MAVMTETNINETTAEEERENRPQPEVTPEPEGAEAPSTPQEEASRDRIDLNQADQEELQRLPGVGPSLASDIVAYREANGPFIMTEDITNVPGIGSVRYNEWEDQLTATLPESQLGEDVPPPPIPEVDEEMTEERAQAEGVVSPEEAAAPQIEEPVQPESPEEDISETGAEELEGPEEEEEAITAEAEEEETWDRPPLAWLWTALLGGVLGLIFSLIVMAGINQTLDYASSRDARALRGDLTNLSSDLNALEGDLQSVQEQVSELADLTERMEQTEADVEDLQTTSEALSEQAAALGEGLDSVQAGVDELTNEMDAVQDQNEKTMNFFEELQRVLQELFGGAEPEVKKIPPKVRVSQRNVGRS